MSAAACSVAQGMNGLGICTFSSVVAGSVCVAEGVSGNCDLLRSYCNNAPVSTIPAQAATATYFIQRLEICFFVCFIGCSSASNKYWSSMSSMACKSRLAASLSFLISKSPPFRVLLSVFFLSAATSFSLCSLPCRFSGQSLQSSSNTNTAAQIRF